MVMMSREAAKFRVLSEQENKIGEMIQMAKKLEGSVRNTGYTPVELS